MDEGCAPPPASISISVSIPCFITGAEYTPGYYAMPAIQAALYAM